MKIGIAEALQKIAPDTTWICGDNLYSKLIWNDDKNKPTEAEIDAEIIRLQAEYDAQEYARNRQAEYPALAEQLDEIYHNGIDSWKAVIKVTKDKYPKG